MIGASVNITIYDKHIKMISIGRSVFDQAFPYQIFMTNEIISSKRMYTDFGPNAKAAKIHEKDPEVIIQEDYRDKRWVMPVIGHFWFRDETDVLLFKMIFG